ncbi:DUF4442 domain-containing protein [Flavimarina sp. Hel_I_48]|uniref:DUF4442 domain-containing protein n=1 Tax=Flavimarina sp. Hel_I_48 TaxID=1392488 RepID=UPI0004DFBDB3|nr:DUF4442 domain-containing protein [Flavimarina sp. Hel_I_48]
MSLSVQKFNNFLLFKLPSAYLCGVRVKAFTADNCMTTVKQRWINQNPFNSMFWAVQGMAAELSTGILVMSEIKRSDQKISMLVISNKASFVKKATGRIVFTCSTAKDVKAAIQQTLRTGEGQTFWMQSRGVDEAGDVVSTFDFEWTVKAKLQ